MSTICMNAPETCEAIKAPEGFVSGLIRRATETCRERRRRRMMRELLVLHDGLLDDLGVSRSELALASRPQLPADVLAWIGLRR